MNSGSASDVGTGTSTVYRKLSIVLPRHDRQGMASLRWLSVSVSQMLGIIWTKVPTWPAPAARSTPSDCLLLHSNLLRNIVKSSIVSTDSSKPDWNLVKDMTRGKQKLHQRCLILKRRWWNVRGYPVYLMFMRYVLVGGKTDEQTELRPAKCTPETYELYRRYQIAVHGDTPDKVTMRGFTRFLCDSPLLVGILHQRS